MHPGAEIVTHVNAIVFNNGARLTFVAHSSGVIEPVLTSRDIEADTWLSPEATAAVLGKSIATVWRRHLTGRLPAIKVDGRTKFQRADVLQLLTPERRTRPRKRKKRRT